LFGLSSGGLASDDDGDFGLGDIDAFIEDAVGDQHGKSPFGETGQDGEPFFLAGVGQDGGDQKAERDFDRHGVGAGEDQDGLSHVESKDIFEDAEFFGGAVFDGLFEVVGFQGLAGLGILAGFIAEVFPGVAGLFLAFLGHEMPD
jgi:hypothetical protein